MAALSDDQLRPECEDLDLSHGVTRLLAAALYWRRRYVLVRNELRNIEGARRFNREHFYDDTQFADWVQSRARFALKNKGD